MKRRRRLWNQRQGQKTG